MIEEAFTEFNLMFRRSNYVKNFNFPSEVDNMAARRTVVASKGANKMNLLGLNVKGRDSVSKRPSREFFDGEMNSSMKKKANHHLSATASMVPVRQQRARFLPDVGLTKPE